MNSISRICVRFLLTGAFISTIAAATEGERYIKIQEDVSLAELVRLNISAGDVQITGTDGTKLTAEATASCQDENREECYKLLKGLDWNKRTGKIADFALVLPNNNNDSHVVIKAKISVPQDKKLEVSLSAGELKIQDTSACLVANLIAGEINISLNESQLASAELSASVGDVKLRRANGDERAGERSMLVGAKLDWKGNGSCRTKASVLTGEARLTLK